MFITQQCCTLYTVLRTDTSTTDWEREVITTSLSDDGIVCGPCDYMTACQRAYQFQQSVDPEHTRYDFRVAFFD